MDYSSLLRSKYLLGWSRNPPPCIEPECSLSYCKISITISCPVPDIITTYFSKSHFNIILLSNCKFTKVVLYVLIVLLQFCIGLQFLPNRSHAPWFCMILAYRHFVSDNNKQIMWWNHQATVFFGCNIFEGTSDHFTKRKVLESSVCSTNCQAWWFRFPTYMYVENNIVTNL
jgi:hypothetical protein